MHVLVLCTCRLSHLAEYRMLIQGDLGPFRPVVCIMQMTDLTSPLAPFAGQAPAPAPIGDACALGADDGCSDPEFAQKLRIAAVFIILATSTLGIWLPVIIGEPLLMQNLNTVLTTQS